MQIFIIGNGFDLHHGIPSRYKDFGAFLNREDRNIFDVVDRYFDIDESFWSDFETRLANFDMDRLTDDASAFLVSYGADDWSDSYHHDYQYEIEQATLAISQKMRDYFSNWVRQLPIPTASTYSKPLLNIDKNAVFLNFNYTSTLQSLYGINGKQILHIHGMADNETRDIVLGHGWDPGEKQSPYRIYVQPEDADIRVVEGQSLIDEYFRSTFKPTEEIIKNNAPFFLSLKMINEVIVFGHSLSEVDLPYFEKIKNSVSQDATWDVSFHSNGEDQKHTETLINLGVDKTKITTFRLEDRLVSNQS